MLDNDNLYDITAAAVWGAARCCAGGQVRSCCARGCRAGAPGRACPPPPPPRGRCPPRSRGSASATVNMLNLIVELVIIGDFGPYLSSQYRLVLADGKEGHTDEGGEEALDAVLEEVTDDVRAHEGRDAGLHAGAGQEDEEHSRAVEQDEHDEADQPQHLVALLGHELGDENEEHVVAVDGDEAGGDARQVVKVVQPEELSVGLVADQEEDDLHGEDGELDQEERAGGQQHQPQRARRQLRARARRHAHEGRRAWVVE